MKKVLLISVAIACMAFSTVPFADDHRKEGAGIGMMMQEGDMSMMNMRSMHEHMANMQQMMDKIHSSKDMQQQHELMLQHMEAMHQGMGMMGMMMSGNMQKGMQGNMPKGMGREMPYERMQGPMGMDDDMDINMMRKRQMMMEQRMDMMQGMMGQMMEHMMQQEKMNMR